jgi:hypothetical protein
MPGSTRSEPPRNRLSAHSWGKAVGERAAGKLVVGTARVEVIPVRGGSEPSQARSALRLRMALAMFGLVCAVVGAVALGLAGQIGWMVAFIILGLTAVVDLVVVAARIRQGPHYQPGPTTPPYRPVEAPLAPPFPARSRRPAAALAARKRRYFLLMGLCLTLFVLAWAWVRNYSPAAAVVMTIVAMAIPPLAAIVANADSPINRRRGR